MIKNKIDRFYYHNTIKDFLNSSFDSIWAHLTDFDKGDLLQTQKYAWGKQIELLKDQLNGLIGDIYFEYTIPRMGKRIDTILLINGIVFVLEFKVESKEYSSQDINQVWDYALDLKYFHEASHNLIIIPILIGTNAKNEQFELFEFHTSRLNDDSVILPIRSNGSNLSVIINNALKIFPKIVIDNYFWSISRYSPTPTIIEAAQALYNNHKVEEISRADADSKNLSDTSNYLFKIIEEAKKNHKKAICFVTGVPGAGKTLVGLNISTKSMEQEGVNAVYLSGNGPLVKILVEALTRDKANRLKGKKITKKEIEQEVKSFIQNVHNFRDACLEGTIIKNNEIVADDNYFKTQENKNKSYAPVDHIAIFDEAQRAWTKEMTADFMKRKKNKSNFPYSEPEFLISCMDRHDDWAIIICLVGSGQEINTGEAGIVEWLNALNSHYKNWEIHLSPNFSNDEFGASKILKNIESKIVLTDYLYLSASLRSFRAEKLSLFVHQLLDIDKENAKDTLFSLKEYPIFITRDMDKAKLWLKEKARGNERYGIIVSSQAYRLRPLAIDVRVKPNPVHWFLNDKKDIRSSYYLEDVVTEFDIQGLELDYSCVVWDADFRYTSDGWRSYSFVGNKWNMIRKEERMIYQKNAYRVLLTRARQGMVIVIPKGNKDDFTRNPEFYNSTYKYLESIGISEL